MGPSINSIDVTGELDTQLLSMQAGNQVISLCESDPGARQVLAQAFPGVVIETDITSMRQLPDETEMVAAGFPCIDVSRAGLRAGMEGESTSLVRHVFRLLHTAKNNNRPVRWVLLENVEAVLDRHGDKPPVIAYIAKQFMDLGYCSWAYRTVISAGFGLPNRRKRVFIVAAMDGDARDVLLSQGTRACAGACKEIFDGNACYTCHLDDLEKKENDDDVSYAIDLGNAMSPPGKDIVPTFTTSNDRMLLLLSNGHSGMLRIEDAERLQGLPEGWTRPCYPIATPGISAHRAARAKDVDATAHASHRWDLLGNAVTVQVARWLGERFIAPHTIKFPGVTCFDRRMDSLLNESADRYDADSNTAVHRTVHKNNHPPPPTTTTTTTSTITSAKDGQEYTYSRNIWSYVSLDEMQEAVLFPYKTKKGQQEQQHGDPINGDTEQAEPSSGNFMDVGQRIAHEVLQDIDVAIGNNDSTVDEETRKLMFQASITEALCQGQIQVTPRTQQPWDKDSWPRCGWWIKGIGAFANTTVTDTPVLTPYQPLGEFIEEVGRRHTEEEASSYMHRMRERGWELSKELTLRLTDDNGITSHVSKVTRVQGLLSDADLVGDIVWAMDKSSSSEGIYWPGEVLDPLAMPPGRDLPEDAVGRLTVEQRRASVPCMDGSYDPKEESAAHRRVLVLYLPLSGSQQWEWHNPADLEPWDMNTNQREKSAIQLIKKDAKLSKLKDRFNWAVQDAKLSLAVKEGKRGPEVEKMKKTRAAMAAAKVDLKDRCGRCRKCMSALGGQRRYDCLTQRMKAAALSGHAGAQIAACGEHAIGARVGVWWEGDQKFFNGVITYYDPTSTEHTISYDDGEVGMHHLWQHDEHIVLLNKPSEWRQESVDARIRLRGAQGKLHEMGGKKKSGSKRVSTEVQQAPLTEYETERADRIMEINRMFEATFGFARPTSNGGVGRVRAVVQLEEQNKKRKSGHDVEEEDIGGSNTGQRKTDYTDGAKLDGEEVLAVATPRKKRGRKSKQTLAEEAAKAAAAAAERAADATEENKDIIID